ncbi:unnamed protein product, partial [Prorocentrum cordatum]
LSRLHLGLSECEIGAEAVQCLAKALPGRVADLHLGLRGCGLGAGGARALAAALPRLSACAALCLDLA